MGLQRFIVSSVLLAASVLAQNGPVASYTNNGHGISVNVPSDTASSGSGPIYFQISAPSGTQWVGFGQGSRMSGSNMFVVYSSGDGNVTLSPRLGTGHSMPQHDSSAQMTLLDGSGVQGDGSMVANVRCDSCSSWSGGSMSFTDSDSSWIYASKSGDALDSTDVSESISQHSSDTSFSLDLTTGTGGSSNNPFVAAAASDSSSTSVGEPDSTASATGVSSTAASTASATGSRTTNAASSSTGGVSNPVASGSGSSSGTSDSQSASQAHSNTATLLSSHGIIMSVLFLGLFPLAALTLYLPFAQKVRYIHAPVQAIALILLIAGMALGIILGNRFDELDGYHQIIGFIVVATLILFQPAMGIYQHLHYCKTGGRSAFGIAHRWLGRTMIMLGIVNGGLGFMLTGNQSAYIPYAIVAAIVFLIYLSVLFFAWWRSGKSQDVQNEKTFGSPIGSDRSYEMQPNRGARHQRLPSGEHNERNNVGANQSMYQQQQRQHQRKGSYTISSRR